MGRVLILGASGKVGRHSARAFAKAGWQVRNFDRKSQDMIRAAAGCHVIVNGMNPPNYHNWKVTIPKITADVIAAARASGATVILPGNVYHFGDRPGVWSEKTPPNPVSRKGRIRLEMECDYAASGVQTIILRAGNFMDPDGGDCILLLLYLRALKRSKITLPGPAETRQAMCYMPDWARAAVQLAEQRDKLGMFEDIPFQGHTLSGQDIKAAVEAVTGRRFTFARFPWWLFHLASPVWELAREMKEMRYLWNTDHALSDRRLKALLPDFTTTPTEDVFRAFLKA